MQTGREAIKLLLNHQKADHVPLHDSPWSDTLRNWTAQGMPTDQAGTAVDTVDHFGFDMAGCGGWFDSHPIIGFKETVQETEEWKIVKNGSGALLKWWKNKSGTPEHVDFSMTSRDIWEREYKPHLLGFDRSRIGDGVETARANLAKRRAQGKWTFYGHLFVWESMRASMGDYVMFMSLLDDPEWILDYCRTYTDLWKACFKILIEEGGKPDGVWVYEDLGYKERLFCNPEILERLIFPFYEELVAFFHSYGLPVVFHSCGYQKPMIPMAIKAGFDALNPMEVKAGNDIFEYAETFGDKLMFVGGFDARILETGDRGLIEKSVRSYIRGMKARGARFLFGSDHSISTRVGYKDFQLFLEVYREEMGR